MKPNTELDIPLLLKIGNRLICGLMERSCGILPVCVNKYSTFSIQNPRMVSSPTRTTLRPVAHSGSVLLTIRQSRPIRVLKEKLADVLENRSERNRWISHFTQFSTMETLDRKAVVHMIQSIKVIGKKELEITFTYQDEYQKAIQLIQLAEQTSQRKVG